MPSERVSKILRSKSNLSTDEIAGMSNVEAWDYVYALSANRKKPEDTRTRITFTGFTTSQKRALHEIAETSGIYRVMSGMAKSTAILVVGSEPGEQKIAAARRDDVPMISGAQFTALVLHGVDTETDAEARRDLEISESDDDLIGVAMSAKPPSTGDNAGRPQQAER